MQIAVISTINHNPGDDFIRYGQEYLIRKVLPDPVFDIIHKHDPRTVFRNFDRKTAMGVVHPRSASTQYAIYEQFSRSKGRNIVEEADIVLFAGTPFIWAQKTRVAPAYSGNAEWAGPIWRRLFSRWTDKPVLNLAAGTSIATANDLPRVLATRKLTGFLTQAYRRAAWTTSRDRLGVKVARALGFEVPMLPCTSLWAAQGAGIAPGPEDYIAVNLMRHAVHRKRGTHTESAHWKQMARILVRELRAHGDILIIAHDEDELAVAEQWFPEHERFYSQDPKQLLSAYGRARLGVCNRVHGAAALAAFDRPALVIGGDTRVDLISQFGLPAVGHAELTEAKLIGHVEDLIENATSYTQAVRSKRQETEAAYIQGIERAIEPVVE